MAVVKPFPALRPTKELASKVASPPYDVLNSEEAREFAKGNPHSFLHINKPEIDLDPGVDLYDESVYKKGSENLLKLINDKVLVKDDKPCFYLYRQIMGKHKQLGLVVGASVQEYKDDKIKKHELTRFDKEEDRLKHILSLNAQTGPVFLTYRAQASIDSLLSKLITDDPTYDFTTDDKIQHTLWVISDDPAIEKIEKEFTKVECLYVADGHHRSASATRACDVLKDKNPNHTGNEEYNYFLTVLFPHDQMYIMDYNRVVKDLNGLSKEEFLEKVEEKFLIREYQGTEGYKPVVKHDFGMYLDGAWYRLSAIPGFWDDSKPTKRLDVSILYENLLKPIIGIGDPRKDKRIDFVGGIRGMDGLKTRVDNGDMTVAFSLHATTINDLMDTADAGEIMPPKSTWFEPKLRSGLIIHQLD